MLLGTTVEATVSRGKRRSDSQKGQAPEELPDAAPSLSEG